MTLALKIDIQTILKMVRFNEEFQVLFKKLSFLNDHHIEHIDDYVTDASIIAKEILWGVLSTLDYITEVNYIINLWRRNNVDYVKQESEIELLPEAKYGHSVVGKIIEFNNITDKYKKLVLEGKRQRFLYNGFKILPNGDKFLQLFF